MAGVERWAIPASPIRHTNEVQNSASPDAGRETGGVTWP
jgi:hypothetical protein